MSAETVEVFTSGGTLLVRGEGGAPFWPIRRRLELWGNVVLGSMQVKGKDGTENEWAMRIEPDDPAMGIEDVLLAGRLSRQGEDTEEAVVHYVEPGELEDIAEATTRRIAAANEAAELRS